VASTALIDDNESQWLGCLIMDAHTALLLLGASWSQREALQCEYVDTS
jgi:hypothetical protein